MGVKTPNHTLSPARCPLSLEDVDLFAAGAQEHWYESYPILHSEAPVQILHGEGPDGESDAFVLTKYEDIETVVKDADRFVPLMSLLVNDLQRLADQGIKPPRDPANFNIALESVRTLRPTDELWRAHRQELTDPWVGPGAKRHTEMITQVVDSLIDKWINNHNAQAMGKVEFIAEFARPLPQLVMAKILGFPEEDVPKLQQWGTAQVKQFVYGKGHFNVLSEKEATEQAQQLQGFSEYVEQQVNKKRQHPEDDMISALTQTTYQALGRKLTFDEINGIVYFMVLGGLETTQYALDQQAQLLCEQPQLFKDLRKNPEKIRVFTEEAMRLRAPTQGLSTRITTQVETFQGVTIPKGSILHLRFGAGNVDPDQYDCPYELNLERKAIGNHLTFSQGPRTCPGAGISRLEQQIAWSRLLKRLSALKYAKGNTFLHQPGIMLGTLELNLEFKKA
ncbi:cytochrome P450 [Oceanicoccus sp. KOV_DT_Chl]|uniref:cytochrome P450 n=1 Tax=Oceanicoccus sp. KOV_DT_Chl TaxID=1904639 RepID=UPI000C797D48|nr:cytochrome P450 [Oceanicoccus sp. KOV_DT_Chl]